MTAVAVKWMHTQLEPRKKAEGADPVPSASAVEFRKDPPGNTIPSLSARDNLPDQVGYIPLRLYSF